MRAAIGVLVASGHSIDDLVSRHTWEEIQLMSELAAEHQVRSIERLVAPLLSSKKKFKSFDERLAELMLKEARKLARTTAARAGDTKTKEALDTERERELDAFARMFS